MSVYSCVQIAFVKNSIEEMTVLTRSANPHSKYKSII